MNTILERETLLLMAYDAVCNGEYDKANALTNIANALPKKTKTVDNYYCESFPNKGSGETVTEIFNITFKEFCKSGEGIIEKNSRGTYIDPKKLFKFFSKTNLRKKDIMKGLRKTGVNVDNAFYKDKDLKTNRAYFIPIDVSIL